MVITPEAFEQAVIEFTHFKTRDSDALIFPTSSHPSPSPSSNLAVTSSTDTDHLTNSYRNVSTDYYDNGHDIHPGINNTEMNVLQYYFFRRYLMRQSQEAIAAALEDIIQYELITAPSSRLKWARAILASVETERNCSPILFALTQSVPVHSSLPNDNPSIHHEWNRIKERITIASSLSSYVLAHTNSPNGSTNNNSGSNHTSASIHNYPHLAGWDPSAMTNEQVTNMVTLPDGLFGVIFRYLIHQLIKTNVPLFNQSSEYTAYQHMSYCIIEQYHKAMNTHQTILTSLPSPTLSALSRYGVSFDNPGTLSTQSATTYHSLTTGSSNSSTTSNQTNNGSNDDSNGTALFSSSSLSVVSSHNPSTTLSGILDSFSRLELSMNDFDRLGVIGSGSYGSVYVWRLRTTGILYAVKEMDKKILKSKSSVHTVVRELACSLAASTPFICGFDFAFTTSTSIYMGMQFAPYGDLERWLLAQNTKRFDEITARYYIAQIVISLKHLHRAGVIHRDLKASNVLIDGSGNVVLTDHGLSVYSHRCSTSAPDYARVCWGQKPDSSDACCLGCLQVSKLKEMQKIAERCEQEGLSIAAAGYVAAEVLRYRFTKDLPMDGSVPLTNRFSNLSFGGSNEATSRSSFTDNLPNNSINIGNSNNPIGTTTNNGNTNKNGAAAMPGSDGNNGTTANPPKLTESTGTNSSSSSSSSSSSTNIGSNPNALPAATATKSSSGFAFALRNFMSGGSRSSSGTTKTGGTPITNPIPSKDTLTTTTTNNNPSMDIDHSIGTNNPYFKPSAHFGNPQGSNGNYSSDGLSRVSQMDANQYQQYLNDQGLTSNCGVSCLSGVSGTSRLSRTNSRTELTNTPNSSFGGGRYSNHNNPSSPIPNPILSPTLVSSLATVVDDTIGTSSPFSRTSIHHILQTCFVNPVVLVASDCHCPVHHDDGHGWYRGRAGTSAYWCPEMIKRDTSGDRISYGMEADWWSLGCLTYALMTGRSPFATGLGTSYDNAQTLEGSSKIHWPKGIFSRDAKDFIARLCTVDPSRRLGTGNEGWRAVMNHPWFKGIDFALLEGRVLPSPSVPTYKISTDWKTIPDKIENQHKGTAAEEAAAAEAQARSAAATAVLSSEDEAIFRACTYTSPDLFKRAWLRFASTQTIEGILALPLEYANTYGNGTMTTGTVPLTIAYPAPPVRTSGTGSRLHSSRTKYSTMNTNDDTMEVDHTLSSTTRRRSQSEGSSTVGISPSNRNGNVPGMVNHTVSPNHNRNSTNNNNYVRNNNLQYSMDTNETGPDIRTLVNHPTNSNNGNGRSPMVPNRYLHSGTSSSSSHHHNNNNSTNGTNPRRIPLPLHQNTGTNAGGFLPRHSTASHTNNSNGIVSPPAGLGVAFRNQNTAKGSNGNTHTTDGSNFLKPNRIINRLTH